MKKGLAIGIIFFMLCVYKTAFSVILPVQKIVITPATATINVNTAILITANVYTETGATITVPLDMQWSVTGGLLSQYTSYIASYTATSTGTVRIKVAFEGVFGESIITAVEIKPSIVRVDITPKSAIIKAGENVSFSTKVIWTDGKEYPARVNYSSQYGTITPVGIYTTTKAGMDTITAEVQGIRDVSTILITPAELFQVKPIILQPIYYGRIYNINDIIKATGYDRYNNEIPIQNFTIECSKVEVGVLKKYIGNTQDSVLNAYLNIGMIQKGNQALFFERGTYTIKVSANGITGETKYLILTQKGTLDPFIFYLGKIDFDRGYFKGEIHIPNYQPFPLETTVSEDILKQFNEGDYLERFRMVCFAYYIILDHYFKIIKEIQHKKFKETIIEPIVKKTIPLLGTITTSLLVLKTGSITVSQKQFKYNTIRDQIEINNISQIKFGTSPIRFCAFLQEGIYNKEKYMISVQINQVRGQRTGEVKLIIYDKYKEKFKEITEFYSGELTMLIEGEPEISIPTPVVDVFNLSGGGIYLYEQYKHSFQVDLKYKSPLEILGFYKFLNHKTRESFYVDFQQAKDIIVKVPADNSIIVTGTGKLKDSLGNEKDLGFRMTYKKVEGKDHWSMELKKKETGEIVHFSEGTLIGGSVNYEVAVSILPVPMGR